MKNIEKTNIFTLWIMFAKMCQLLYDIFVLLCMIELMCAAIYVALYG